MNNPFQNIGKKKKKKEPTFSDTSPKQTYGWQISTEQCY